MGVFQRVIDCSDLFTVGIAGEGDGLACAPALEVRLAGVRDASDVFVAGGVEGARNALRYGQSWFGVARGGWELTYLD